jgi:hypothetical protein
MLWLVERFCLLPGRAGGCLIELKPEIRASFRFLNFTETDIDLVEDASSSELFNFFFDSYVLLSESLSVSELVDLLMFCSRLTGSVFASSSRLCLR